MPTLQTKDAVWYLQRILLELSFQHPWYSIAYSGFDPNDYTGFNEDGETQIVQQQSASAVLSVPKSSLLLRPPAASQPLYGFRKSSVTITGLDAVAIVPGDANRNWLMLFAQSNTGAINVAPQSSAQGDANSLPLPVLSNAFVFRADQNQLLPTLEWWGWTPAPPQTLSVWEIYKI